MPRRRRRRSRRTSARRYNRRSAPRRHASAPRRRRRTSRKRYMRVRTGRAAGLTPKGRPRRRVNRRRSRRHYVRGYTIKRGRAAGRHVHGHYSFETPAALENPLSTGEVVVVGVIGVLGALVAQGADRFVATHALTGTVAADGSGLQDAPGKGQDYNAVSVGAPMGLVRWLVAAGLTAMPLVGAHYIKSPMARTSVQAFGFGVLIRTGLKAGSDAVAWMTRKTAFGQRLFLPEITAHAMDAQAQKQLKAAPDTQLPAITVVDVAAAQMLAGIPQQRQLGVGKCGDCAQKKTQSAVPPMPPPPPAPGVSGLPFAPPPAAETAPAPAPAPAPAAHSNGVSAAPRLYATFTND